MRRCFLIFFLACFFKTSAQQNWGRVYSDTTVMAFKPIAVGNKRYLAYVNHKSFILIDTEGATVMKIAGDYFTDIEINDFNGDGFKDILITLLTNIPGTRALILFDPQNRRFRKVKDFALFPEATRIPGSHYFYSYRKSGCADQDWDSDLFYLKNWQIIRIGNIAGRECDSNKKQTYIYKVTNGNLQLKKVLYRTIGSQKWSFIKDYWENHFKDFR